METRRKTMEQGNFQALKRKRSNIISELSKLYKATEIKLMSRENEGDVKIINDKIIECFNQLETVHLDCIGECKDVDVASELKLNFESCSKNFGEFRERISQWLTAEIIPDVVDEGSVVSQISSVSSSRTKLLSARAKRQVAEHKLKTLKKLQDIECKRRALENQQKLIENQTKLLEQESEIEQALIEENVWQESICRDNVNEGIGDVETVPEVSFTRHDSSSCTARDSYSAAGDTCVKTGFPVEPQPRFTEPTQISSMTPQPEVRDTNDTDKPMNSIQSTASNVTNIDAAFQHLATALHEGFNLPKPELLRFNGSSLEYCKFICNFDTNIDSTVCTDKQRLSYLIQHCDGEAKRAIEDCVLMEPSVGYKRARDILQNRYGKPHVIARSYIDRLVYGPPIKSSDTDSLSQLALEMQKCEITLSQLGFVSDIDNSGNLRRIVKRLPMHLRTKWVDVAHSIQESGREPRFSDLVKFIDTKSRVACSMYGIDLLRDGSQSKFEKTTNGQSDNHVKGRVTTLTTYADSKTHRVERKCCCCLGPCLELSLCKKFKTMTLGDRKKVVHKSKLCYNCLKPNHMSSKCRKTKQCTVTDCTFKHHILLHSWVISDSDHTVTQPSVNCASTAGSRVKTCLGIIPVTVFGENGKYCKTYALLDDGADKTLCDERLLRMLKLPGQDVTYRISTISSAGSTTKGKEIDLRVRPVSGSGEVYLRKVWTVKQLPISTRSAASTDDIQKVPYFSDIVVPHVNASDVMLLIGTDSPDAHIPIEVRSGDSNQPYAVRTRLGWAIRGPIMETNTHEPVNVNFGQSSDVMLQQQLERMWRSDFNDVLHSDKSSLSIEDKRALHIMESTLTHENGHYKLGLPWRDNNISLPNNMAMAHARLQQLKRKLSRDPELHEKYTETVTGYIEKNYAKELTTTESTKRTWYLPHHPVINENKPGKVRVVFDCASKCRDISLNSQLLQGPDLMNSLVGVLIRFRQYPVAIVADVEAMFHQVHVIEDDCDALRFLWWPGGDMTKHPKTYCMKVHLFGATSSPSCAAYALKRTANDNAEQFDPEVISTVHRNFYVDDCLKSVMSENEAIKLATDLQSLMSLGGFRLTKWLSNSRRVLNTIPEAERAPSVIKLEPGDSLPVDRALGVTWDVNDDTINFKVKLTDKPTTRRGILSVVSSIFDPLGLVSPVTLRAKAIVQKICKENIGWDDPLPQRYCEEWEGWLTSLPHLEGIITRRCFIPEKFGNITNTQLHVFSDGSELGYGACAYLRMIDEHDNITCTLLIGKSRLAPIKQISIPRLELSGAVIACRLQSLISEEIEMKIDQTTFWTDSTILLGYIKNVSRRFKTFVGNRLSVIQESTTPDQWRHVDSGSNPADIASRGIDPRDVQKLHTWLHGPEFLQQSPEAWPFLPSVPEVSENDTELKKLAVVNSTTISPTLDNLITRYSDWTRLQRAVVWLLRFKCYCRRRYLKHNIQVPHGMINVTELRYATKAILWTVQSDYFMDEITSLKKATSVKKDSRLASLSPMLDHDLVRVYGRHQNKNRCPVILPHNHHVTTLLIRHYHQINGHVGAQQVLAATREKYWILRGPSSVKRAIGSCFICKRYRSQPLTQQMAPLLPEQTTPEKPPFTFIGVDYFGPLLVKSGQSLVKRYGCLFTCLASRAVHIEVAHSLTTDSFIAAFQRFTSRRGTPDKVYSDNATNLVSGDRELRASIKKWNQSKLGGYMAQQEIEWSFNPPYASHRGGVWERLIRSTRSILKAIVGEQLLTDEKLVTLMAEAEKIINDRPITPVSNDPRDPLALTPSMLLLMKTNSCIPRGIFEKEDNYSKRWWKQIHYLSDVFWRRWIREYLPSLQKRQKWQRPRPDLRVGNVVLVVEDNVPRGQWSLGKVIEVVAGRDGHVRSCVVRTKNSESIKPITKLCLLEC